MPFARGEGPACARPQPCPSDLPLCEGKEAAGRAGEDSSPVSNLLLRDSPGTAPGKARSLFPLQPPGQRDLSVHPRGGGRRAPEGTLHVIPGRSFLPPRRHGRGRVGPGSEGCRDSGCAGAHLDRLPSQEAPGRAAEPSGTWRYLPRAGHALSKSEEENPAALLHNYE